MLDCGVKKIAETLGLLVVVGGLLFLAGCGKKNIKEENVAVADKSAGEQLAAVVSKKDKRESLVYSEGTYICVAISNAAKN